MVINTLVDMLKNERLIKIAASVATLLGFAPAALAVEGQTLLTTSMNDAVATTTVAFFNTMPYVLGFFGLLTALGLVIRFFTKKIGRKAA